MVSTPLKNMKVSWDHSSNIWKNQNMFQTTNQKDLQRCPMFHGYPISDHHHKSKSPFQDPIHWRYLPYIRPIFEALVSGNIPRKYCLIWY